MTSLYISTALRDLLWQHLLPAEHELEQAAFLFARQDSSDPSKFICEETYLLGSEDLEIQLPYHIELADHIRPQVIKRAHDSGQILIEAHSHLGNLPVRFSKSDLFGFEEWVPHVRWRLKGRPYAAIVVAKGSFDGFVWRGETPERLDRIEVGGHEVVTATGLSGFQWVEPKEEEDDE